MSGQPAPAPMGPQPRFMVKGLRLPGVRLFNQGTLNRDIDDLIFSNVRTPEERRGDLRAQVAANHRGSLRVQGLAEKYGVDLIREMMQGIQDYSERMIRKPAGPFRGRGVLLRGLLRRRRHPGNRADGR